MLRDGLSVHIQFRLNFVSGRATAQAVSRRPPSAEALLRSLSVNVTFLVHNVALGRVLLPVLRFSLKNVIPSMILTYRHLRVVLTRKTYELSLGTFQKAMLFGKPGSFGQKVESLSPQSVKWLRRNKPESQSVAFSQQLRLVDTVSFVRRFTADCYIRSAHWTSPSIDPLSSDVWPEGVRSCLATGFCAVLSKSWKVTTADMRNGHGLCKCDVFWGQNSGNVWVMSAGRPL